MIDLPPQQVVCVAQAIWHEARGESELGQRAVGHVIINRSKKQKKPPCSIIRQPGQFSFKFKTRYSGKAWNKAWQIANYLGREPTGGALYFKSNNNIRWKYKLTTVIGNHAFYK